VAAGRPVVKAAQKAAAEAEAKATAEQAQSSN
jgi:hypothetical protein